MTKNEELAVSVAYYAGTKAGLEAAVACLRAVPSSSEVRNALRLIQKRYEAAERRRSELESLLP